MLKLKFSNIDRKGIWNSKSTLKLNILGFGEVK
jgi:hypothetical protein